MHFTLALSLGVAEVGDETNVFVTTVEGLGVILQSPWSVSAACLVIAYYFYRDAQQVRERLIEELRAGNKLAAYVTGVIERLEKRITRRNDQ